MAIRTSSYAIPFVLLTSFGFSSCETPKTADTIFVHARIWTGDAALPLAEAVAVYDGRIIAVGDEQKIRTSLGPGTIIVDVKGKLMLPGFIDGHAHFMGGGFQLQSVDLRDAANETQFTSRIAARARSSPDRWITGGDWDHDRWPGGRLPTKELIDRTTPHTPVFVSRYDGHMALANSVTLRKAGITKDTPDPPGGSIVRDARTGEPTGILKDEAMSFVWRIVPSSSEGELLEAADLALDQARRCGLTGIQDISSQDDLRAYRSLREQGKLTTRMYCRLPLGEWPALAQQHIRVGSGDEWIRLGSTKAFADGSLGSSTALFFAPYLSDPLTHGLPSDIALDGRLAEWAKSADSVHLQLSVHAIGDSANSMVLSLFEHIAARNASWDRRFRIEHAQHLRPGDFVRFAALGVLASVQPYHAIDDGRWAEGRIGHTRCASTYAFKSFLDAHVRLCFGSDWTVAPLNPLTGIYAAVTRRTTDGKHPGGWFPEQKISVEEAVKAYTMNNAYASFEENEKGTISPGKLADFVVLSEDIFTIDPNTLADVKVLMTVVGGVVVYINLP